MVTKLDGYVTRIEDLFNKYGNTCITSKIDLCIVWEIVKYCYLSIDWNTTKVVFFSS